MTMQLGSKRRIGDVVEGQRREECWFSLMPRVGGRGAVGQGLTSWLYHESEPPQMVDGVRELNRAQSLLRKRGEGLRMKENLRVLPLCVTPNEIRRKQLILLFFTTKNVYL